MKKLGQLVAGLIFAFAAFSSFAQGTINFNNHTPGQLITHVYAPDTLNPFAPVTGNGSNDLPSGTTVYTGALIGGTSTGTYAGQNFTAQLWATPGTGQPIYTLQPVTQYTTTFLTQASGGGFFILATPSSDPGIPNTDGGAATLQIRAWDNAGGTVPDWGAALHSIRDLGMSPTFDLTNLGSGGISPNLTGLQSFSLTAPISVPEPSTFVLIALGGVWFGLLRRRGSSHQ